MHSARDSNTSPDDAAVSTAPDDDVPVVTPPRGFARRQRLAFKDALMVAFHRLGGVEFLVRFGQENPGEFARLCAKLIPQEIRAHQSGEVIVRHVLPPPYGTDISDPERFIPHDRARRLGYFDDHVEDAQSAADDSDIPE
jgi:hypothetical protein